MKSSWLEVGANKLTEIDELMDLPKLKRVSVNDNQINFSEGSSAEGILEKLKRNKVIVHYQPQQLYNYFKKLPVGD